MSLVSNYITAELGNQSSKAKGNDNKLLLKSQVQSSTIALLPRRYSETERRFPTYRPNRGKVGWSERRPTLNIPRAAYAAHGDCMRENQGEEGEKIGAQIIIIH